MPAESMRHVSPTRRTFLSSDSLTSSRDFAHLCIALVAQQAALRACFVPARCLYAEPADERIISASSCARRSARRAPPCARPPARLRERLLLLFRGRVGPQPRQRAALPQLSWPPSPLRGLPSPSLL